MAVPEGNEQVRLGKDLALEDVGRAQLGRIAVAAHDRDARLLLLGDGADDPDRFREGMVRIASQRVADRDLPAQQGAPAFG
jgi:hypothetical protein